MTRIVPCCLICSESSRSRSNSAEDDGLGMALGNPSGERVRQVDSGAVLVGKGERARSPAGEAIWRWAMTKGAGMISKPKTRVSAAVDRESGDEGGVVACLVEAMCDGCDGVPR